LNLHSVGHLDQGEEDLDEFLQDYLWRVNRQ
jgi:hypothetical protein